MGKALYRKYRSKSLHEIIGQEHITTTLANALKSGKIAHAYLLTGPRGVGKTSIARILAHEINQLPYSEDQHLDIIEIDAASNNGVEDVRDLRDKIPSAPVSAAYKVFIIDEVHMLSKAAFNALLKTLEEPPAHVIFILATTEAYKLPETIISRTQRFAFRPVSPEKVIAHLRTIAKQEKITIDDPALELIATHGEGSFRDSISLLDQVSNITDKVTLSDVERLLGLAPSTLIERLHNALAAHNTAECLETVTQLYDEGYEPAMIAAQLSKTLREQYIAGKGGADTLTLLKDLLDVPASRASKALLEITLLSYAAPLHSRTSIDTAPEAPTSKSTPTPAPKHKEVEAPTPTPPDETIPTPPLEKTKPSSESSNIVPSKVLTTDTSDATIDATKIWQEVLQRIKQSHNTLYGIARMAAPRIKGDTLTLELKFAFHQKRLDEPRNRAVLAEVVEAVRKTPTQVICLVAASSDAPAANNESITAISNIFGGAELLES